MTTLNLEGNIILGPHSTCEGGGVGAGIVNLPFGLGAPGGCGGVSVGRYYYGLPTFTDPASFVAVSGVGTGKDVTKGLFMYIRSSGPVTLRLTQDNVVTPQTLDVDGLCLMQFPIGKPLTLLEVKGSASLEIIVTGNQ